VLEVHEFGITHDVLIHDLLNTDTLYSLSIMSTYGQAYHLSFVQVYEGNTPTFYIILGNLQQEFIIYL